MPVPRWLYCQFLVNTKQQVLQQVHVHFLKDIFFQFPFIPHRLLPQMFTVQKMN